MYDETTEHGMLDIADATIDALVKAKFAPTHLTPSIDSYYFTAGKRYKVQRVHGYRDSLATVICDQGHQRVVSLDRLGERCPHLHPKTRRDMTEPAYSYDKRQWRNAGHWRAA